jgi:thiol-disulfide isomerase/thioredoxin
MLIDFYGEECPHCKNMEPLLERLEREHGLTVKRCEVWHNAANARKLQEHDKGRCGGVPFFVNTETGAMICGEDSYDKLKIWAGITK